MGGERGGEGRGVGGGVEVGEGGGGGGGTVESLIHRLFNFQPCVHYTDGDEAARSLAPHSIDHTSLHRGFK